MNITETLNYVLVGNPVSQQIIGTSKALIKVLEANPLILSNYSFFMVIPIRKKDQCERSMEYILI